jgi:hypothetical protein
MTEASPAPTRPDGENPLVTVQILGLPVGLHGRATEHGEELQREFALIAYGRERSDNRREMPRRLLSLIATLQGSYGGFTTQQEDLLDRAIRSGQSTLDLTFQVPADAAEAATALRALLDEADDYCREGKHLLTLATPPDLVAYRRWYLGEFVDQIRGAAPTPWSKSPGAPVDPQAG